MTSFLTKYISRYLFVNLLFSLAFLLSAIWLTQSLKFLNHIVNSSVSLAEYIQLVSLLIPDLVGILLPISSLLAAVITYKRLKNDHELTILKIAGLRRVDMAFPAILMALIICSISFLLHAWVSPATLKRFRNEEHLITTQFSEGMIQPATFNMFNKTVIYAKNIPHPHELEGVYIYSYLKSPYTLIAQKGYIHQDKHTNQLLLKLIDGQRQDKDEKTGHLSTVSFKEFEYDLSDVQRVAKGRSIRPYEMSLFELFSLPAEFKTKNKLTSLRLSAEWNGRILAPILCMLYIMWPVAIILSTHRSRKNQYKLYFYAAIPPFLMHALVIVLTHFPTSSGWNFVLSYLLVIGSLGVTALLLRER